MVCAKSNVKAGLMVSGLVLSWCFVHPSSIRIRRCCAWYAARYRMGRVQHICRLPAWGLQTKAPGYAREFCTNIGRQESDLCRVCKTWLTWLADRSTERLLAFFMSLGRLSAPSPRIATPNSQLHPSVRQWFHRRRNRIERSLRPRCMHCLVHFCGIDRFDRLGFVPQVRADRHGR
jgi:hypothetical protein